MAWMPRGLRSFFLFEKRRYGFSVDSAGFALENYVTRLLARLSLLV
jgi:hypothetical protein